jgi:hypothetical protein
MSTNEPNSTAPEPYEFSADDNVLFSKLASKMQFVGLFALGLAVVAVVVGALRRDPASIFAGALYAVIGLWTERAGASFHNVVFTQGHDITHLLHALRDLRRLYTVQYWICFVSLIAAIVFLGATVVASRG